MKQLNIFLGHDPNEHDAYLVARNSIERRSSVPVLISPLVLEHLGAWLPPPLTKYGRMWDIESDAPQSTEFARTRFCVPFLQKRGWALFADSDILCLTDIAKLFALADEQYAVMVVKHDYTPSSLTKKAGHTQTAYARKNWSSVVLWNCGHVGHWRLSRERLNQWAGRRLHGFEWLQDDEIGELPAQWNVLVGEQDVEDPKILHYTKGTPDIVESPYADEWFAEKNYGMAGTAAHG